VVSEGEVDRIWLHVQY